MDSSIPSTVEALEITTKVTTEKIIKGDERFRLLLEVTGDGYWEWYPKTNECYFSESYYTMLGYEPGDFGMKHGNWRALVHPDDIDLLEQRVNQHLQNEQSDFNLEIRLRTKSGGYKWINTRGRVVLRDENGDVLKMAGTHIDITERKSTEKSLLESQRTLSTLISNLPGFAYRCKNNPEWEMEYISSGVHTLTGYHPEDLIGNRNLSFNDLINNEYKQYLWDRWQALLPEHSSVREEYTITAKDGTVKWVWEHGCGVYSPEGELLALEGFIYDITDRKQAEDNLYTEKELLRVTLHSIGDGVITTDERGNIIMLNQVAEDLTGWTLEATVGKPAHTVFKIVAADNTDEKDDPVKIVLESGKNIGQSDQVLISAALQRRAIAYNAAPIKEPKGNIRGVVLVFRDITKEKEREQDILYLSFHDGLTGLYNRAFIEEELRRLDTAGQLPLTVILGDVNGLKMINDIYGHHQGDLHLLSIAQILHHACRADDIVARWGGDEFIILLPKTDGAIADSICDKIRDSCRQMDDSAMHMSISLGYATKENMNEDITQVLREAEDSMYKAKLLESKSLRSTIISSMRQTLYERSHETEEHAERLGFLSRSIGLVMGLPPNQLNELELLGTLHDIGKIAIKDSILTKEGPLNEEEWLEMKRHPEIGFRIALGVPELAQIAEYILCHHERWDGKGYPQGLKNIEIPLLARILAVVDTFDAITNDRPYRKGRSLEEARSELLQNAGTQFDPEIVRIFLETVLPGLSENIG